MLWYTCSNYSIFVSFSLSLKNVKVIAFGKVALKMVTTLEGILGEHITEGVASVPVGSLETARRQFPQYIHKKDSKIRSV